MLSRDARTANLLGALGLEAATVQPAGRGAATGALVTIAAHPNRTVEELREPLGLSQPGAARLVQRLVDAGWVERAGPGGRGGLRLTVTSAGHDVVDEFAAERRAALLALLEPLEPDERDVLAGLLERMLAARTEGVPGAKRLCRQCERRVCSRCPVARAA
ncbi:MAG TPA: MarR family transcriptional regulator [Solirubrobacteraceae bacterium]|nr:MarR family transcriptional regulator [Solirubrobacteraceae bacterium]